MESKAPRPPAAARRPGWLKEIVAVLVLLRLIIDLVHELTGP